MGREFISLVSEHEEQKMSLEAMIQNGSMTKEVYDSLTPEEQEKVREVLFNMHSEPVEAPMAFSALEFTVFGLAKIFFKKDAGEPLTEDEQAFYNRFKEFIEQHEITMDANDWYIPYAKHSMLTAKANRAEYKAKKRSITGQF